MEDIVAIKIKDKIKGEGAFITWGRLYHPVDPTELFEVIKVHFERWGIKRVRINRIMLFINGNI